ncbi:MAG: hypothetical protein MUC64_08265, partial [Rubritepida sp.]|nr:hypothetical protein [Rubritepida sp.]
ILGFRRGRKLEQIGSGRYRGRGAAAPFNLFWQHHPRRKIAASQHPDPYKNDLSFVGAMVYQKKGPLPRGNGPS